MPEWILDFDSEAERDLTRLDREIRKKILDKLDWLVDNFDSIEPLYLREEWQGFCKLRIGEWRAVYKIERVQKKIIVRVIDRRDKIYKRRK